MIMTLLLIDFLLRFLEWCFTPDPSCCYVVWPALITAGGALLGTVLGTSMQSHYNREAWQEQNKYNSPVNQMQLYKNAGFNPATVFSANGKLDSSADAMQTPDVAGNMTAGVNAAAQSLSMATLKQELMNKKEEGRILSADAKSKELDNQTKEIKTRVDIDRLLAADDAWIRFDDNGMKIGTLTTEGEFSPMFDSDGTPVLGPEGNSDFKMSYYEGFRDALRNGFAADTEYFNSKLAKIESAIKEEFGRENAAAIISQLKAAAFAAQEQGRDLKLDNDFFQNLKVEGTSLGGKSAEMLLKVLLRVLGGK